VQFAEAGAQPQQEFHPLELVEHFLEDGPDRITGCFGEDRRCVAEGLAGHGAIPAQGTVTDAAAGVEVLGHEPRHGNAVAFVDPVGHDQFGEFVAAGDESKFDATTGGFGNALQGSALQGAVSTPCPGQAQHLHRSLESIDQLLLSLIQGQLSVSLVPLGLLHRLAGGHELIEGEALLKERCQDVRVHEHRVNLRAGSAAVR